MERNKSCNVGWCKKVNIIVHVMLILFAFTNVQSFHISETWVSINYFNILLDHLFLTHKKTMFLVLFSYKQKPNVKSSYNFTLFHNVLLTFSVIFFFTLALLRTSKSKKYKLELNWVLSFEFHFLLTKKKEKVWRNTDKHKKYQCFLCQFWSPWQI